MIPYRVLIIFLISILFGCEKEESYTIISPEGSIQLAFNLDNQGIPTFQVNYKGQQVIKESPLGIHMEDKRFADQLSLEGVSEIIPYSDAYKMHQGKKSDIIYQANERTFALTNTTGDRINLVFRVSNDGIGFRYEFPNTTDRDTITNELTGYNFPVETKMWVQPMSEAKTGWESTNPSYEEPYYQEIPVGTSSPLGAGWVYPALFRVDSTWILISETGLKSSYCGTRLAWDSASSQMKVAFPDPREVFTGKGHLPTSNQPWTSPWRILTIGSLDTIIQSTLGTDLAEPAIDMDESFVAPGYASWSWALLKDNSINYDTTQQFIDYAGKMNWQYCLIDVNWDTRIGFEKLEELIFQGKEQDVGLILWYNSAGDWNTTPYEPKSKLLTREQRRKEFSMLQEMGIKGVKIDFFGGDGQSMIEYYHDILRDAAEYELLVNFHGATLPRGWHRTYPHLMTMESIKGFEFITFFQEVADQEATHAAMLPFTRNAFDPMDFTPMCFSKIPNIKRKTTRAFELALPTLFHSGIQHLAEVPWEMAEMPDYVKAYLSDLPVQYDETRLIKGYPGKYVVLARRSGETWFIAGINGEAEQKDLALELGFLEGNAGILITDGEESGFKKEEIEVSSKYAISLKPNGGFVMKINE